MTELLIRDLIEEDSAREGVTQVLQFRRGLLVTLYINGGEYRLAVSKGGKPIGDEEWKFVRSYWPREIPAPPEQYTHSGATLMASWRV